MKNRVLLLAAAAALAAPGLATMPGAQTMLMPTSAPQGPVGNQAPQGGIGSLLDAMRRYGSGGKPGQVRRRGRRWSFAQVQRMKTKRRNKLRAKGQFRQAVR